LANTTLLRKPPGPAATYGIFAGAPTTFTTIPKRAQLLWKDCQDRSVPGLGPLRNFRRVQCPFVRADVLEHHYAVGMAALSQAFAVDSMTGNACGIDRPFFGAYVFEQYRTGCKTLFAQARVGGQRN
jgi:hypothetical protein